MASFLSSVTTLVNPASQPTSSTPIHATFSGSYEKLEPSIKLLNQNGYPSEPLKKGKLPFTTSSKNIKVSIPTVAWRVTSMSSKTGKLKSSGAKSDPGETLFSSKEHEMIDIRKRSALGKVVEMLIGRRCQEPRFGFAMKAVSQEPNQAERDIVDGMISVGYQYSTAKVILKCQKSTDQELEMKFDEILNHLDRRGVLWDRAGRRIDTFEDSKNIQVEFLILGAFPKSFLSRVSGHCPPNSGLSDPLPSDLSEAKLVVDSKSIEEFLFPAGDDQTDPLEGAQISITREPFRGGAKGFNTPRSSGMGMTSHGISVGNAS